MVLGLANPAAAAASFKSSLWANLKRADQAGAAFRFLNTSGTCKSVRWIRYRPSSPCRWKPAE